MATVAQLRPHAKEEYTSALGMTVFLASWTMMFATLFFAYGFVRMRSTVWPPPGAPALPLALPIASTCAIVLSSFTLARGLADLRRGRRRGLSVWVAVTVVLGAAFIALQCLLWRATAAAGLSIAGHGLYAGGFYALTVFHGLHALAGVLVLGNVLVRSLRGVYTEHDVAGVRLTAMFWHFVDVVWIVTFVSLYVV